ncbi:hypothetical protein Hanom_Chr01g00080741 [Helianthus anomalus]
MPVNVQNKEKSIDAKQKGPMFAPKQIWKPKEEFSNGNIQNNSNFYVNNVSKGQMWVIKKKERSVEEKKLDSTKKVKIKKNDVFKKIEKDFPRLNETIQVKLPKTKQPWVALFK